MPSMPDMPDMPGMPLPWQDGPGHVSPCVYVSVQWIDHDGDEHHDTITLHKDVEAAQLFPQVYIPDTSFILAENPSARMFCYKI